MKVGMTMGQKFYAVRRGRKPGIYRTWPEAQRQVQGFPGARYKSFATRGEAQAFLTGEPPKTTAKVASSSLATQSGAQTTATSTSEITVYTDGGSRNTGNVAGGHVRQGDKAAWAYRIELPEQVVTDSAGEWGASNNRMEIMAFLQALQRLVALDQTARQIQFVLDSQYVLNAVTKGWLSGWKRRGWKRSAGPLANAELWQQVDPLLGQFQHLSFHWTKGHATNQGNVFVDHLLNTTMDQMGSTATNSRVKPTGTPAKQPTAQPANQQTVDQSVVAIRRILQMPPDEE